MAGSPQPAPRLAVVGTPIDDEGQSWRVGQVQRSAPDIDVLALHIVNTGAELLAKHRFPRLERGDRKLRVGGVLRPDVHLSSSR
jgi:hypothetical protein